MTEIVPVLTVSADHFAPYTGDTFYYGGQPLELVELQRFVASTLPRAKRTGFSLLLRARAGSAPEPGLHHLQHTRIKLDEPVGLNRIATPIDYIEPGDTHPPAFYEVIFN